MSKILEAAKHIKQIYPDITQVFYSNNGCWFYCDDQFNGPKFDHRVDTDLLDETADEVYALFKLPTAFTI